MAPARKLRRDSGRMISPFMILVGLAILLAVAGLIWPNYPLVTVGLILLAVGVLVGR